MTALATAGTLMLEFGTLSRLTGEPRFLHAAQKALAAVWQRRSPHDLVGAHINIVDGEWTQLDAGIGGPVCPPPTLWHPLNRFPSPPPCDACSSVPQVCGSAPVWV